MKVSQYFDSGENKFLIVAPAHVRMKMLHFFFIQSKQKIKNASQDREKATASKITICLPVELRLFINTPNKLLSYIKENHYLYHITHPMPFFFPFLANFHAEDLIHNLALWPLLGAIRRSLYHADTCMAEICTLSIFNCTPETGLRRCASPPPYHISLGGRRSG